MEFGEFVVDEYKYGGKLQRVLFDGAKSLYIWGGGAIFAESQVSLFEDYSNGNYSDLLYLCFLWLSSKIL